MLELGGTQKENAPQRTKSGKSEKIVQELLRAFSRLANTFTFDRTSDVNNNYPLMNICSGVVTRNEDAEKLLQASLIGEQKIAEAVSKKFNSTTTFFARIKKVMRPTFVLQASIALQPIVEIKTHPYDRKLLQKMAVIAMSRTVDLRDILTYELGPVPLSLAKPNGNMNKTAKSKLMQEFEVDSSVNDISTTGNESSYFITDLMALVQIAVTQNSILFEDIAVCLSKTVSNAFRYANTVVICPDRYDVQESIKCFERSPRRKAFVPERKIMHENQTLSSNFKEFLMNPKNNCNFVTFLSDFWTSFFRHSLAESQKLLIELIEYRTFHAQNCD